MIETFMMSKENRCRFHLRNLEMTSHFSISALQVRVIITSSTISVIFAVNYLRRCEYRPFKPTVLRVAWTTA